MEENPQICLSPSNSVNRRNNNDPHSPEFEFWMVRNPSFPQTTLLSADELIVDGVLLPLHLVSPHSEPTDSHPKPNTTINHKQQEPTPEQPESELLSQPGPGPESATSSSSKRWRDIFKRASPSQGKEEKENACKEKKKDRKAGGGGVSSSSASSGAELNINIWPFSRSWSGGNRSRIGGGGGGGGGTVSRKVSSAPCSRSNSAGESKSRKWPNSPSRGGGVHLGRNSPVWQLRRGGGSGHVVRNGEKGKNNSNKSGGGEVGASKNRGGGLNLNVPMCIGYRQQLSCRRDENILLGGGGGEADNGGGGVVDNGGGNKLMYLRTLFTKKVY